MTVYLEFDSLISINDKERHYAFPTGKIGLRVFQFLCNYQKTEAYSTYKNFIEQWSLI